jgi:hypothetical protein
MQDLDKLPPADYYWIKPKQSCDGIGADKLTREGLVRNNPRGYVIQPFLEFQYEPSFFFVDNQFDNAIWAKHRLYDERVFPYEPLLTTWISLHNTSNGLTCPMASNELMIVRPKECGRIFYCRARRSFYR